MEQKIIEKVLRNIDAVKSKIIHTEIFGINILIRTGKRKDPKTIEELANEKDELLEFIENLDWDIYSFEEEVRSNYHSCKNKADRDFCIKEYKSFLRKIEENLLLNTTIEFFYDQYLEYIKKHFIFDNIEIKEKIAKPKQEYKTFDDVLINENLKISMYEILKNFKLKDKSLFIPNSDYSSKKGKGTLLYSLILSFKRDKYFHKISNVDLYPLINERFKINNSFNSFKNAKEYGYKLK